MKARLQSVTVKDRFTAVMVESYHLSPNPLLLDIVHQLLPLHYVQFFTTAEDLNASAEFLKRPDIEGLANKFNAADYAIPAPSATPAAQPSLALVFDPAGPDRSCSDFTTWKDAQAFFWATENDSHNLDPDGDDIACETLPGAPQSQVVVVTPPTKAHCGSDEVRFYDPVNTHDDLEWMSQGGQVGLEVKDSDLDVPAKFEGTSVEVHYLSNESTFFLTNIPVDDRNDDGFVNWRDVSIIDTSGNPVDVDRASYDGRVDLVAPYTGEVRVSYWGSVRNDTGDTVTVKSQADPIGIPVTLEETDATSGVFGLVINTSTGDSDATSDPPTLKVGKNDVITLTYRDADPRRTVSATLTVATRTPTQIMSRSNPWPMDGTCYGPSDSWCVAVTSVAWDAWPQLQEESIFYDEPPGEGFKYVLVKVSLLNRSMVVLNPVSTLAHVVGDVTNTAITGGGCGLPDDWRGGPVYPGDSATDNYWFIVPESDIDTLVMRMYLPSDSDFAWYALRP